MDLALWEPLLVAAWRRLHGARQPGAGPRAPDATGAEAGAGAPVTLDARERRLVLAGATRLSQGLTRERELAGARYFEDPQLLGAYLLLYWPVSYAQASSVLGEVGAPLGDVLDVGSGPGPLALAALDAGARSVRAVDRSDAALAVARQLAGANGRAIATDVWEPGRALPRGPFDTILLGHVLNELHPSLERRATLIEELLARLRPGGCVVVIEPAMHETSRALLGVRDLLVARGASVRAPCLFRGPCPALAREDDWCHAERPFAPPPLVAQLADEAKLHRDTLKMSYLIVQPPGATWPSLPSGRLFRIVSESLDRKGQHRRIGCGPEGRAPLVLPQKHVRDGNRELLELSRGDVARVEHLEPRGDGLRLDDHSVVEKLAPAGTPVPRGSVGSAT
jgi:SAM-dependent methyltransferase